jgi:hypothetical protein
MCLYEQAALLPVAPLDGADIIALTARRASRYRPRPILRRDLAV